MSEKPKLEPGTAVDGRWQTFLEKQEARLASQRFRDSIVMMSSFVCDHARQGYKHCDEADLIRGACCNSCWARRFAKWLMDGTDK